MVIMSLMGKFRTLRYSWKTTNKKKALKEFKKIRQEHGFKEALKATYYHIKGTKYLPGCGPKIMVPALYTIKDLNKRGNEIFIKEQNEYSLKEKLEMIDGFEYKPTISILMPIYSPNIKWLKVALDSLINQDYPYWELIAVDDGSKKTKHFKTFEEYCLKDKRIRFIKKEKNEGISLTTNYALKQANTEFIGLMDQDDEITKDALFFMVKAINENPDADWFYSNECKATDDKKPKLFHFYFKPDFDPILLTSHMYTSHFTIYRKSIIEKAGLFNKEYDFSQDYELALRISKITNKIVHVDRILYFWRSIPSSGSSGGKDFARIANLNATKSYFKSFGIEGEVDGERTMNYFERNDINGLVSIIIPTDNFDNLVRSIDGIINTTDYQDYEIIPVTNSKVAKEIKEKYQDLKCLNICIYDEPFNFSRKCNCGAKIARGEYVLFYNDDVYPLEKDWLLRMMDYIALPYVGSVSPLCQFENGGIQYAGMVTGAPGLITTSFISHPAAAPIAYPYNHMIARSVSVMSGACCLCKKEVFNKVGGFNEIDTPNGHSDVVLSFDFMKEGYLNIYNPYAQVVHIGNHSWHAKEGKDKCDIFVLKKYLSYIYRDPYFTNNQFKEYSTNFRGCNFKIYAPKELKNSDAKKDVLILTHELTRSGAPSILLEQIKLLLKLGYFPILSSLEDGPLKEDILNLGVTVMIDDTPKTDPWIFNKFARNFDLVLANTIATHDAVNGLAGDLPEIIWWTHEGNEALDLFHYAMPKRLKSMQNVHIYNVSNISKDAVENYFPQYKGTVAGLGFDVKQVERHVDDKIVNFITVGPVERRKGYDHIIEAIKRLDEETKRKIHFTFVAYKIGNQKLYDELESIAKVNPDLVTILGGMSKDKLMELYAKNDYLLVPSNEETVSMVALEAMAIGLPVIITKECGATEFIPNNLKEKLTYHANDIDRMVEILKAASDKQYVSKEEIDVLKHVYQDHYSSQAFEKTWTDIYNSLDK